MKSRTYRRMIGNIRALVDSRDRLFAELEAERAAHEVALRGLTATHKRLCEAQTTNSRLARALASEAVRKVKQ